MNKEKFKKIAMDIFTLIIFLYLLLMAAMASGEENKTCLYILKKLSPQQPVNILSQTKANLYITLQKDIVGESKLSSPVHAGIKINIPLLDPKEKYQLLKERLRNIQYAYRTINQYLTLKAKVEEEEKYIKWQWERVKAGIEYKKDIWEKQIKYKQDLAQLKAIEIYFTALGISKNTLENCYKSILKTPKTTGP